MVKKKNCFAQKIFWSGALMKQSIIIKIWNFQDQELNVVGVYECINISNLAIPKCESFCVF